MNRQKRVEYCFWTEEQVARLLEAVARVGTNWALIKSENLPEKDTNAIKNKFYKLIKYGKVGYQDGILSFNEVSVFSLPQNAGERVEREQCQLTLHKQKMQRYFEVVRFYAGLTAGQCNDAAPGSGFAAQEQTYCDIFSLLNSLKCLFESI